MNSSRRLYGLCLLLFWTGWVSAAEFRIHDVQLARQGNRYLMNMQIDYRLSETALEALSNGVPLTLEVQVQVEKVWRSFWEQRPAEFSLRRQIRYHALTGLYRVVDLQTEEEKSFVTQDAALDALGEMNSLKLVSVDDLNPKVDYHVRMRAELDIESLPLPLRPLAYLGKGWKMTSGWSQWPLAQ
ncbi:MAG: DUF4390 domain-containing protein [Pseudomonadota bacterium]